MKKTLISMLLASAAMSGVAHADTYQFDPTVGNWFNLFGGTNSVSTSASSLTLTVNSSGNSSFTGHIVSTNGSSYFDINVTLTGAYASGSLTKWSNFSGTFASNTTYGSGVIRDANGNTMSATDAAFGVNAAPNNPSSTTAEFGWWAGALYRTATSTTMLGKLDLDLAIRCSSGSAGANKMCTPSTSSSSGGTVPVPGSLALLGAGLVGLAVRRKSK